MKNRIIAKGIFIIIIILSFACIFNYSTIDTIIIIIDDKERHLKKYMVHGQHESFSCTDNVWFLKFDSTEVYRELKKGKTYRVLVNSWRIPLFSMYRNILNIEKELEQ